MASSDDTRDLRDRLSALEGEIASARRRIRALEEENRRLRGQAPARTAREMTADMHSEPHREKRRRPAGLMVESEEVVTTQVVLAIHNPDGTVCKKAFHRPIIKIGRGAKSHLQLDGDRVSRMHAVIEVDLADAVRLIDLGSAGGTFVNGKQINRAELRAGDKIEIGQFTIRVAAIRTE